MCHIKAISRLLLLLLLLLPQLLVECVYGQKTPRGQRPDS
jgi:hypothetical protein